MTSDSLRHGDVERALMEWRSLLRHIVGAPDLEWDRWRELKEPRQELLEPASSSPALSNFRRSSPRSSGALTRQSAVEAPARCSQSCDEPTAARRGEHGRTLKSHATFAGRHA